MVQRILGLPQADHDRQEHGRARGGEFAAEFPALGVATPRQRWLALGGATTSPNPGINMASGSVVDASSGILYLGNGGGGSTVIAQAGGSGYVSLGAGSEAIRIISGGNVGIATSAPRTKLEVDGTIYGTNIGVGSSVPVAQLDVVGTAVVSGNVGIGTSIAAARLSVVSGSSTAGDSVVQVISNVNAANSKVFEIQASGEVFSDVAFSTPATDVAETFPILGPVVPGDVLVIDLLHDERLTRSTQAFDPHVAGVVSTKPGVKLGVSSDIYVALAGRVPVRVTGDVKRGDILVSSDEPGMAMACPDRAQCTGAIVGKALSEVKDGKVIAIISLQ